MIAKKLKVSNLSVTSVFCSIMIIKVQGNILLSNEVKNEKLSMLRNHNSVFLDAINALVLRYPKVIL